MPTTRRGVFYVSSLAIAATLALAWVTALPTQSGLLIVDAPQALVRETDSFEHRQELLKRYTLAKRDQEAFVELAKQRYHENIRGYTATFTKQERVQGRLLQVQQMLFRYRVDPKALYLEFLQNADKVQRVLWEPTKPEYTNANGEPQARVEPLILAARLLGYTDIYWPIDGPAARAASRHTIAFAGFGAFFQLWDKYHEIGTRRGDVRLSCGGLGELDGRPTVIIIRELPYTGLNGIYPDARLIIHFDLEHLVPVAVYAYADKAETQLLGSYVYTDVEINPNFDEDAFSF